VTPSANAKNWGTGKSTLWELWTAYKRDAAVAQTAVMQIKVARDALTAGRYLSAGYYETQLKLAESAAEQLKGR
jgi:hypothetical protein